MRILAKISIPCDGGNKAVQSGELPKVMRQFAEAAKVEGMWFGLDGGRRTAWAVFDIKNTSDMPMLFEPLFMAMGAEVVTSPVMTADDLQAGLGRAQAHR